MEWLNFNLFALSSIAKNAFLLSDKIKSDKTMLCDTYYSGAGHLESYQSGAKQLRKGFASHLSSGDTNAAFYCATRAIHFSLISAEKDLTSSLKEIDYYLRLLKTYKSELAMEFILFYRETVSTLIDRGERYGIETNSRQEPEPGSTLLEVFYFHAVLRNFWLGYTERCHYFAKKSFAFSKQASAFTFHFYYGK